MSRLPSDKCQTMAEVRAGVDALDRELVALIAERLGYMRAAARIKPNRNQVRDEPRKQQVIDNACAEATRLGIDSDENLIADLWETLVEASIAYELRIWDQKKS